jgi:DNA helicase-2/ATP-dependent DNA helicase PcrA
MAAVRGQIQRALADYGQPAAAEVLAEISLAKNRLLSPDSYEHHARHTAAPLIATVWREAEIELQRSNAWDFDDLLTYAVRLLAEHPHRLAFYRQRWRWLVVDEYQDTNEAQSVLVALLAGAGGNVCCVGDDDQCMAEGTPVTMADGSHKPIEQVKRGDLVLTATGAGARGAARVLAVRRRRARFGIAIRTAGGRTVISTPEHIHFAGYRLGLTPQQHLVYLMHRHGYGFRVGMTSVYTRAVVKPVIGLQHRCLQERGDAAWVISTHRSEQAARIAELQMSLRYGIPTLPFVARAKTRAAGSGIVADQAVIDELFAAIDSEAAGRRLLSDEGLSEAHPHHIAQSSEGRRRTLTITLCGAKHGHRLDLTGTDEQLSAKLREAGYRLTHPKRTSPRHWRLTMTRRDLGQLVAEAERIAKLTGARIRSLGSVGGTAAGLSGVSLPLMPASAPPSAQRPARLRRRRARRGRRRPRPAQPMASPRGRCKLRTAEQPAAAPATCVAERAAPRRPGAGRAAQLGASRRRRGRCGRGREVSCPDRGFRA